MVNMVNNYWRRELPYTFWNRNGRESPDGSTNDMMGFKEICPRGEWRMSAYNLVISMIKIKLEREKENYEKYPNAYWQGRCDILRELLDMNGE